MDPVQSLGTALGLGFASGIRLYATVLALGLAIRLGWFHPAAGQEALAVAAKPVVMIVAGAAFLVELVADKIPWLDSLWDSFHTFIRPIGAALLASAALGTMDPTVRLAGILLSGGVAATSHSAKAATRLAVNQSPEPFSNMAVSFLEDMLVPVGVWVAVAHPYLSFAAVVVFVVVFGFLFARVFRSLRVELVALRSWLTGRRPAAEGSDPLPEAVKPAARTALGVVARNGQALPEQFACAVSSPAGREVRGICCAADRKVPGLRDSIGYLAILEKELVFVTRRVYLNRVYRIGLDEIEAAGWSRGLLMNRLTLRSSNGKDIVFKVFKNVPLTAAEAGQGAIH